MKNKGPEWEYVVVCPPDEGHKSEYNRCKLCQHEFQGGASRIRGHFLRDKKIGVTGCKAEDGKLGPVARVMRDIEDRNKQASQQGTEKRALDRATSSTAASTASAGKKQRTLGDCVRGATKEECDEACVRLTSGDGLPESLVESPFFRDFVDKVARYGPGYKPPARKTLRGPLLQKEIERVKRELKPFHEEFDKTGGTMMWDGWTDCTNRPLENIILANSKGAFFHTALEYDGPVTSEALCEKLSKVLGDLGPKKIVLCISDSAANCKLAGQLLEERFPHITWLPCATHICDLALKDLWQLPWAAELIRKADKVVSFMRNHQFTQSLLREFSTKELIKPAVTRFGTNLIMIDRLIDQKEALQKTVIDRRWKEWGDSHAKHTSRASKTKKLFMDEDGFWNKLVQLRGIYLPVYLLLRKLDTPAPVLSKVYHWSSVMLDEVRKAVPSGPRKQAIMYILESRRAQMLRGHIHAAAHALDPEYLDYDRSDCFEPLLEMVEKLSPSKEAAAAAMVQYEQYSSKSGLFGRQTVLLGARDMPPHAFWSMYGKQCRDLQPIATKLLSLSATASGCEQNWSTFSYVHSDSRNSLTSKHATDLVWLYSNLRLLKRTQALEQGGKAVPWMAVAEEEEEEEEGCSSKRGPAVGEDSNDKEQA